MVSPFLYLKSASMKQSNKIEWLREGGKFIVGDKAEDRELRDRLLQVGVIRRLREGHLIVNFVGVAVYRERTIVALPKVEVSVSNEELYRQVVRAMRVHSKWRPQHHIPTPFLETRPDHGLISGIAATNWLVNDFLIYGLYRRTQVDFEINGGGKINWASTIARMKPIFSRGRPIYVERITRRSEKDSSNFTTMLHLHLLERLSAQFGPILDYEPINLDHEPVDRLHSIPSVDECKRRLGSEMRVTYSERGLELLRMLRATVEAREIERSRNLAVYGTSYFHNIWESACGAVLGNAAGEWQDFIPKPIWKANNGEGEPASTFIPDIVIPLESTDNHLLIADAKYYCPKMPPGLDGVPGVNDVAKQIWYKQRLSPQADVRNYTTIDNVFLFPASLCPGSKCLFERIGQVEFPEGEEKVDAVNVDFMKALKVYSEGSGPSQFDARIELGKTLEAKNGACLSI